MIKTKIIHVANTELTLALHATTPLAHSLAGDRSALLDEALARCQQDIRLIMSQDPPSAEDVGSFVSKEKMGL